MIAKACNALDTRRMSSTLCVYVTAVNVQGTVTQVWRGSSVVMGRSSHLALVHWVATAPTSHVDRYLSSTTTGMLLLQVIHTDTLLVCTA